MASLPCHHGSRLPPRESFKPCRGGATENSSGDRSRHKKSSCRKEEAARTLPPGLSRTLSVRERIGPDLEVDGEQLGALAAFAQPRRAVAAGAPQAAALPAAVGIVDAPVEPLGIEAERIRHAQRDHLTVLQCDQATHQVGGRHRDVLAEPERVVLVDPGVIARLGAVITEAVKAGPRILVEGPALRTVIAGGVRPVERSLALAPVEA